MRSVIAETPHQRYRAAGDFERSRLHGCDLPGILSPPCRRLHGERRRFQLGIRPGHEGMAARPTQARPADEALRRSPLTPSPTGEPR